MPEMGPSSDVVQWFTGQNTADLVPQSITLLTSRWPIGMHVQIEPATTERLSQQRLRHHSGGIHARSFETLPHPVQ